MRIYTLILLFIAIPFFLFAQVYTWTGAAGTTEWHNKGNWNPSTIPGVGDEVFITGATIDLEGDAFCKRLSLSGTTYFTIKSGITLTIDGENTTNADLVSISSDATLSMNESSNMVVQNLDSNTDSELIDLRGDIQISDNANLTIQSGVFSAPSWSSRDREAMIIRDGATLNNSGIVHMNDFNGNGIIVYGTLHNTTTGEIHLMKNILYNGIQVLKSTLGSPTFINEGLISSTMDESFSSTTLEIGINASGSNSGMITITNSSATFDCLSFFDDFTNEVGGRIIISDSNGITLEQNGVHTFTNLGTITMTGVNIGTGLSIRDGAEFDNNGEVYISGYAGGMSTNSAGDLINRVDGQFYIAACPNSGINNVGEVQNYGLIDFYGCGGEVYRNTSVTTNFVGGRIQVRNCTGTGIRNGRASLNGSEAIFHNYGDVDLFSNNDLDVGLTNLGGLFTQQGKLKLNAESSIRNSNNFSVGIFKAKDTIDATSFINSGATLEVLPSSSLVFTGDLELNLGLVNTNVSSSVTVNKIEVQGNIKLNGTLDLDFIGGYVPSSFSNIDIITYDGTRQGFFDNLTSNIALNDHMIGYSKDGVIQLDGNQCGNARVVNSFLPMSGNWSAASNWSQGHVPFPCEVVEINGVSSISVKEVTMNSNNSTISQLLIGAYGQLTIASGKQLTVDRNYQTETHAQAVRVSADGLLLNNGTFIVENVDATELIRVEGLVTNTESILLKDAYGNGSNGIRNLGTFVNEAEAILEVRDITATADNPVCVINGSDFVENGTTISDINFSNGLFGTISGNGTINVPKLISSGIIAPGNSTGVLNVIGDLDLYSESTLNYEINGSDLPGTLLGHDQIKVTGDVVADGTVNVTLNNGYEPTPVDKYSLINYSGDLTGTFTSTSTPFAIKLWDVLDDLNGNLFLLSAPSCLNSSVTWTGAGRDDFWTTATNWEGKLIPQVCHTVIIPNGSTVIIPDNETVNIDKMTLSKSSITIGSDSQLTLNAFKNEDPLLDIYKSTVSNKGILILDQNDSNRNPHLTIGSESNFHNYKQLIINNNY